VLNPDALDNYSEKIVTELDELEIAEASAYLKNHTL